VVEGGEPVFAARIWLTPTSKNSVQLSIGRLPSALLRVVMSALAVSRTPSASASSAISWVPRIGSFQSAITCEVWCPFGRERRAMPADVSVRTAEPGSSASTLA
jgi:hypothetical protein